MWLPQITKIIPQPYQDKRKVILIWILIGLFIRLILMPITLHPDLLESYWAADVIVNKHIFNLGQYVKDQFGLYGGNYLAPLAYLHALFFLAFKPFISSHQITLLADNRLIGIFTDPASHRNIVISFVSEPHIFRTLFLFKLPYLLFDFASAFLILRIIKDVKKGLFAFKFWMVNFVGLFITYVWGKYEIIPVDNPFGVPSFIFLLSRICFFQ